MNYENKLFDLDEELDNVEDWVQAIPPVKWFNERIKAGKNLTVIIILVKFY